MPIYPDRIMPTNCSIYTYLDNLREKQYQIPTFQREVVWDRNSVKKLWDSIFRFYPIGSILIWKTDLQLQNHRSIGGHEITDNSNRSNYKYILDGQQRTTSLLTSLYGGTIEGRVGFNPTLYFDLSTEDTDEIDDDAFRQRFLFWDEIDDSNGAATQNQPRMARYNRGLIVKLRDVMEGFGGVEKPLARGEYSDYDHPIRARLRDIRQVLDNYRLSFIELQGIEVSEVCQIFERINQAGKPLDIFDIVVAKTFRIQKPDAPGFYLRELIEDFRNEMNGNFAEIDDLTYLQALAVMIREQLPDSNVRNITPVYLNRIKTEHIRAVWPYTKIALRRMFDFFDNHLHIKGPRLIPYRYYYLSFISHFYDNPSPNYDFLKQYFWYYAFHAEDLLSNTTHLWQHVDLLRQARDTQQARLDRFLLDKQQLRAASYSTRGRMANAILCLLANHEPRDWAQPDRHVLVDVYYAISDKPNLHHVFPLGFVSSQHEARWMHANSMINIAYLTQMTNLRISDRNPVEYMRDFDGPGFETVLRSHLVPLDVLEWARNDQMPESALTKFIEMRIQLFVDTLRAKLPSVTFGVVDTREGS